MSMTLNSVGDVIVVIGNLKGTFLVTYGFFND